MFLVCNVLGAALFERHNTGAAALPCPTQKSYSLAELPILNHRHERTSGFFIETMCDFHRSIKIVPMRDITFGKKTNKTPRLVKKKEGGKKTPNPHPKFSILTPIYHYILKSQI